MKQYAKMLSNVYQELIALKIFTLSENTDRANNNKNKNINYSVEKFKLNRN